MLSGSKHGATKLRLLLAVCCAMLLAPATALRATSSGPLLPSPLSENESRPLAEAEGETEVLLDCRRVPRGERQTAHPRHTSVACDAASAGQRGFGMAAARPGRGAESLGRNGCGAALRC